MSKLFALAAVALAACSGDPLFSGTPGQQIPMQIIGGVPRIDVSFDGESTSVAIDTGSPLTVQLGGFVPNIEPAAVDAFGLSFPSLTIGRSTPTLFGPPDPCSRPPLRGVVGADVLGLLGLTVDYRDNLTWLSEVSPEPLVDASEIASVDFALLGGGTVTLGNATQKARATRIVVEAIVEGQTFQAVVDTGAGTTVVSERLLTMLGGSNRPTACCLAVETFNGEQSFPLSRLASVSIGGLQVNNVSALVTQYNTFFAPLAAETGRDIQLLIGGSWLRSARSFIDLRSRKWRIERYGTTPHIPPREWDLPGAILCATDDAQAGVLVEDLFEGTDAAANGVERNDLVTAIDGQSTIGITELQLYQMLWTKTNGQTVTLDLLKPDLSTPTVTVKMERVLADL